jgi:hypothetical protein
MTFGQPALGGLGASWARSTVVHSWAEDCRNEGVGIEQIPGVVAAVEKSLSEGHLVENLEASHLPGTLGERSRIQVRTPPSD